jgi:Alr-MurF fusion protein
MPKITLRQVAEITQGKLKGRPDQLIEWLETDSRRISIDIKSIFIAIKGPRHDGHDHIAELYQRGLRNFLVLKSIPESNIKSDANFILVENTVNALQALATYYRKNLHMPLIAISGSNGKTVVKEWLFQCLSHAGAVSRSPKSYNSQIGVPLSLWMLDPTARWSIIEAGISQPGEMALLEKMIAPDFGLLTNIGQAHQENFTSISEKVREKLVLFSNVKTLYYCRDHEPIHQELLHEKKTGRTLISWSHTDDSCYLYIVKMVRHSDGIHFVVKVNGNECSMEIPFPDDASLENCLHIITFLFHQGFDEEYIRQALMKLNPVAMRLEQVKGINESTLINDSYNSDINSLRIALDFLALQKQHKKHTLILSDIKQSGMTPEELYREVIRMVGSYHIDQLVVIGEEIIHFGGLPKDTLRFKSTLEFLKNMAGIDITDHAVLIKGAREYGFEQIVGALSEKKHTTVLEINLNNLVHNLNYFRGLLSPGTRVMVMVKALSYGSGSYEIANLLQHEKVDYLGVAFTDEGVALRQAGITLPIMVMAPSQDSFDKITGYNLEPEIFSFSGLEAINRTIALNQLPEYPVHIKLDTGMHRLGFMPGEVKKLANELSKAKNLRVKALFSHLAVADNPAEDDFTREQISKFEEMYYYISEKLGYKPMRHILNSAGIERFPKAHFEMVRLGIGLHGISSTRKSLKAVSTLKTRISQIKNIPQQDTVGYNRRGKLTRDSVIGLIPIGYADGLDRKLGNRNGQVIVNGIKVPFIGDICMDISMIDLTGLKASEGDEVIVFGEKNPIQQLAGQVGTIPYEILTNVSSRVKRVYVNE